MNRLFSSGELAPSERFRRWLAFSDEHFMPMLYTRTDENTFEADAYGATVGDLAITRTSFAAVAVETTNKTIRHPLNEPDILGFSIKIAGDCVGSQYDRMFKQRDGDISVVDTNAPFSFAHLDKTEHMLVRLPRSKVESLLGPARNFAAISMRGSTATNLVRSFFSDLLDAHAEMSPNLIARMSSIGTDLITAALAECMARETPKQIRSNIAVYRAKQYILANIANTTLSPAEAAAASGVSIRQLQVLFSKHGQTIGEWIWQRRLEAAAERLADPSLIHLPIAAIAYGCGFVSQAHFSRVFKECFQMRPTEYRRNAFL